MDSMVRPLKHRKAKAKEWMRNVWAGKPIELKIKDLVKLQEITATLHPELRNIIPWKLKK